MEPPQPQSIQAGDDDPQDKVINDCCSCWYDCIQGCLDFLCCESC
ncbi:hypothetical protein Lalb_Chr09g0323001 [Lupinus albus]|uniref:Uncharacterized protein n=1 Tax=Lupinus albus TaxID=3870 RepID=A0A6A4PZ06_LUPAL|nr:hypothetical protein Lalb_Chr09g0323001 [Lupinus albus]